MSSPYNLVSPSNHVGIAVDDEKEFPGPATLKLAQEYEVPKIITQILVADVAQANAAAVISAFFAGALMTLQGIVIDNTDGSERLPQALRWFSYSAVFLAFASTFLCLTCVRMCSDLPIMAAHKILDDPNCWPARVLRNEPIPANIMRNRHELLRSFGGANSYQAIDIAFNLVFMFDCFCTFVALILFIWKHEDTVIAGPIMATVLPTVLCVIWSFRPALGFRNRISRAFR